MDINEAIDWVTILVEGEMKVGLNISVNPSAHRRLTTVVIRYNYSTSEIVENNCYWYYTGN